MTECDYTKYIAWDARVLNAVPKGMASSGATKDNRIYQSASSAIRRVVATTSEQPVSTSTRVWELVVGNSAKPNSRSEPVSGRKQE